VDGAECRMSGGWNAGHGGIRVFFLPVKRGVSSSSLSPQSLDHSHSLSQPSEESHSFFYNRDGSVINPNPGENRARLSWFQSSLSSSWWRQAYTRHTDPARSPDVRRPRCHPRSAGSQRTLRSQPSACRP